MSIQPRPGQIQQVKSATPRSNTAGQFMSRPGQIQQVGSCHGQVKYSRSVHVTARSNTAGRFMSRPGQIQQVVSCHGQVKYSRSVHVTTRSNTAGRFSHAQVSFSTSRHVRLYAQAKKSRPVDKTLSALWTARRHHDGQCPVDTVAEPVYYGSMSFEGQGFRLSYWLLFSFFNFLIRFVIVHWRSVKCCKIEKK